MTSRNPCSGPIDSHRAPAEPPSCRRRRVQRGFTLVELLVALSAGILVAVAALALARNSSLFFRREARLSAAQYSAMVGLNRLQADLQRASFLTIPNTDNLDFRLVGGNGGWLKDLAGITIIEEGSSTAHDDVNGLYPDAVILAGAFSTTEKLGVRTIQGTQVYLQTDDSSMKRLQEAAEHGAPGLSSIFKEGRIVRIQDDLGWSAYGVVGSSGCTSCDDDPLVQPVVNLSGALPLREATGHGGVHGLASAKYTINPVTRVRYDVRLVEGVYSQYSHLYDSATHDVSAQHKGVTPAPRYELVRVELSPTTAGGYAENAGSLEILAEYAVDLKFGITSVTPTAGTQPTTTRYAVGDSTVYTKAAPVSSSGAPEEVSSVKVRLSVRSAGRDRDWPIELDGGIVDGPTGGGLYRFNLGSNSSDRTAGFARVRNLYAEVELPNNHLP